MLRPLCGGECRSPGEPVWALCGGGCPVSDGFEQRVFSAIEENQPIGPRKVILSLTDWCNLRCGHCWRMDKTENPNRYRDQELTFDEIGAIFRDCKALGVRE